MKEVLAFILGGGQGTRLFPLTKLRAKPAVPIGGKFRLIDIPISNCIHWGVKKIFVLTQFNTVSLHRHISNTYKFDGFSKGFLHVLAAQQTIENKNWYQGTADAVRKNLSHIKNQDVEWIVILSGDQLYRINLAEFIESHRERGADISIASKPVTQEEARGFGILNMDDHNTIVDFFEKPENDDVLKNFFIPHEQLGKEEGYNYIASMGIYVFNKQILIDVLEQNDAEDFGREVIPAAIKKYQVSAHIFDGYWEDIGTIKSFFHANLDFANPVPRFDFYDERLPIFTRARFLPGSKIGDCRMENTLICDGSIIDKSEIKQAVIGIRSIIRAGCTVENVIMMGADFYEGEGRRKNPAVGIGNNCRIRNAILDKNVRIGNNVVIDYKGKSPGGRYAVVDGIVVIQKNEVVDDDTRIE